MDKEITMKKKIKQSKRRKIKKYISRWAMGELGRSVLEVNLYNRRKLSKKQREESYVPITIYY